MLGAEGGAAPCLIVDEAPLRSPPPPPPPPPPVPVPVPFPLPSPPLPSSSLVPLTPRTSAERSRSPTRLW